ncbi:hypothetical protein ACRALDRAFT_2043356 [Sodiomyces alcalophilus JCM 7366]|uniref:uncharacterized protein n=1 Tax=Sodiomyces alcalophilus JCM 7366 TaxID=591952 RepID=UPI0039B43B9B
MMLSTARRTNRRNFNGELVSNIPRHGREQISRSASSSTKKYGMGETVNIDQSIKTYERIIAEMRVAVGEKPSEMDGSKNDLRKLEGIRTRSSRPDP